MIPMKNSDEKTSNEENSKEKIKYKKKISRMHLILTFDVSNDLSLYIPKKSYYF